MEIDFEPLWDINDFATWLKLSQYAVYHQMAAGFINSEAYRKVGRQIRFLPETCRELLQENRLFTARCHKSRTQYYFKNKTANS